MRDNWWKYLLGVWMAVIIVAAFLFTPTAKGLGQTTRVLYFHVPSAWVTTLAFFISALYSLLYLIKHQPHLDIRAEAAAQIGLIFAILTTVTGSIWAKEIWHSYWNWDPRETSIFMLLLIYAAYFALRSAIEDPEQRARLSAVYSLLAFATVPFLVFVIPRIYDSLHPDPLINPDRKIHMDVRMLRVFLGSFGAFTVLFYWLFTLRVKVLSLEAELLRKLEE